MDENHVTDLQLSEWRKLEGSTPPGPWRVIHAERGQVPSAYVTALPEGWEPDPLAAYACLGVWTHEGTTTEEIAAFIAAAREAVPALLAEVERLRALIDRDRTGLARGLNDVVRRCQSGDWIAEGRGDYAYHDDRYRQETRIVLDDVISIAQNALRESGRRADEAFHGPRKELR